MDAQFSGAHPAPAAQPRNGAGLYLHIDRAMCSGHGRCYSLQPDHFSADEEGFPIVPTGELAEHDVSAIEAAVLACPERALTISAAEND